MNRANEKIQALERESTTYKVLNKDGLYEYIRSLVPWLPLDFFTLIDSCENMIFSLKKHILFGNFILF
jgi:hypothetical protein